MRIRRRTRRGLNWGNRGCAPRFNLFPFLSGGRATTGTMVRWAQINRDASMFSRRKVLPRHSGVAPHLTSPCFPHANVAVALPGHAGVQYYDRAAMIPPSSNIAATLAARTQQVGGGRRHGHHLMMDAHQLRSKRAHSSISRSRRRIQHHHHIGSTAAARRGPRPAGSSFCNPASADPVESESVSTPPPRRLSGETKDSGG